MKNLLLFLLLIAAVIWLLNTLSPSHSAQSPGKQAFETPSLAEVHARIDYYHAKPVIVSGVVVSSWYVCGVGCYIIDDGTAQLRVFTDGQPPMQHKMVSAIIEPKLVAAFDDHFVVSAGHIRLLTVEARHTPMN